MDNLVIIKIIMGIAFAIVLLVFAIAKLKPFIGI